MNLIERRQHHYDELLAAARGELTVDTLIHGGRFLNVLTGEILKGNLTIHKGFIVGLCTHGIKARETIDATGMIALPAFIDPHIHIESSMVLPPAYAAVVAANGTGTIFADPHEIVNVLGVEGFQLMADNAAGLPARLFFDIPTCVPAKRGAETSGADISAVEVKEMARRGGRKLGELMSFEKIVNGDPVMTDIVKAGWELDLPRDAHFPMIGALGDLFGSLGAAQKLRVFAGMIGARLLRWRRLNALPFNVLVQQLRQQDYPALDAYLVALGLTADHETYGPEMQVKLDHGMRLMISSGIFALPQTTDLFLQGINRLRFKDGIGLCTDDIWPDELVEHGGMVNMLRELVKRGIDPIDAVRFATLNNAQRLAQAGIPEAALLGSLAPGMAADIVLVADPLRKFHVRRVLHEGHLIAENGKLLHTIPEPVISHKALDTVRVAAATDQTFHIKAPAANHNGAVLTRVLVLPKPPALPFPTLVEEYVPVKEGVLDTAGYAMIAVFDRYRDNAARPTLALIKGYTLKAGAVASTVAHDSHNLIVLGTNRADMTIAANAVRDMRGGLAAVQDGRLLAQVPLPVGGLMSNAPTLSVADAARAFRTAIATLGLDPNSPIIPFAIFSLPAAPGAKVTDRGVWDAEQQALVPLFPNQPR